MIFPRTPRDWRDLQTLVRQVFLEMGCESEIQERIETARSTHEIDVFVRDNVSEPSVTYLCECKYWNRRVDQEKVLAFRQLVTDAGAHRGFLLSKLGGQTGALRTSQFSNVDVLTISEFEVLFMNRWLDTRKKRIFELMSAHGDYSEVAMHELYVAHGPFHDPPAPVEEYLSRTLRGFGVCSELVMRANWHTQFPFEIGNPLGNKGDSITIHSVRECVDVSIATLERMIEDSKATAEVAKASVPKYQAPPAEVLDVPQTLECPVCGEGTAFAMATPAQMEQAGYVWYICTHCHGKAVYSLRSHTWHPWQPVLP